MVRVIYLPPTSDPDLNTDLVQVSQMQQQILPDLLAISAHSMQRQRTTDSSQPRNRASLDNILQSVVLVVKFSFLGKAYFGFKIF
jgi:hypothetical protein